MTFAEEWARVGGGRWEGNGRVTGAPAVLFHSMLFYYVLFCSILFCAIAQSENPRERKSEQKALYPHFTEPDRKPNPTSAAWYL